MIKNIINHVNSSFKRYNVFYKEYKKEKMLLKKNHSMILEEDSKESSFQSSAQNLITILSRYKLQDMSSKS